jgi:hypothetical protein
MLESSQLDGWGLCGPFKIAQVLKMDTGTSFTKQGLPESDQLG